jgi:hypothetical protein
MTSEWMADALMGEWANQSLPRSRERATEDDRIVWAALCAVVRREPGPWEQLTPAQVERATTLLADYARRLHEAGAP